MRVEESTVILGPIARWGGPARPSTRHRRPARSAGRPRNGPPDAVQAAGGATSAGAAATEARHWWRAQCSESTGTISAPGVPARPLHHRRAGDQRLLVGQGQPPPGLERGQRHRQPGEPDHPVDHDVGRLGRRHQALRAAPAPRSRRARRRATSALAAGRRWPPRRGGSSAAWASRRRPSGARPGPPPGSGRARRRTTSTAWVPIEPGGAHQAHA